MLCSRICYIACYIADPYPPSVPDCPLGRQPYMPVLKPRHCLFNPLLVLLHKHLREAWTGRTINTSGSLAGGGGRQAENPLAALMAGSPDFNTEELEAFKLLRDRGLPTLDNAKQAAVMTMAEAVKVSNML